MPDINHLVLVDLLRIEQQAAPRPDRQELSARVAMLINGKRDLIKNQYPIGIQDYLSLLNQRFHPHIARHDEETSTLEYALYTEYCFLMITTSPSNQKPNDVLYRYHKITTPVNPRKEQLSLAASKPQL
ncbi:hypothetical protein T310_1226 [Rasamsonia emersonii CBS 393.64]|uniref:Uncharacterized protein n=1 Tax=Rasamsonia emersonii (strain ATCC 16479 / CBS 393.64 / IMI 116815) TaxID=1408163 RepID=A0A0F4Z3V5_RASE3|nr:hypothetical protein T310_1226 [Rasamsonia emersonii CBS 393.64]KKA24761.1 hypothetical protein T310_1226 [Rasamsonia emersonii CBS 393.64]